MGGKGGRVGGVVSELGRVVTSVPFGTAPDQGQMKCIRRCSQKQEQLPAGFLSLLFLGRLCNNKFFRNPLV